MMTLEQIQKRINVMPARMAEKGLAEASADCSLKANAGGHIYLNWRRPGSTRSFDTECQFLDFDGIASISDALDKADAWIASLPSKDEAERDEFLKLVATAVDFGRARGFDAEMINPLTDMMKRISSNAITYQPAAA
jgi:hypothetical protein